MATFLGQDVGADDRDHRQQGDAGDEREELDCLAEAGLERRRAAALHFAVSVFSFFANSGLAFIAPAQPAS
jgi:hypothetical protein